MTEPLTLDRAISLAKEMVEGHEDFVYKTRPGQQCVYVRDGMPSCLVGCILHAHGVSLEYLAIRNTEDIFVRWNEDLVIKDLMDESTATFLTELQMAQDRQNPWGTALRRAIDNVSVPA